MSECPQRRFAGIHIKIHIYAHITVHLTFHINVFLNDYLNDHMNLYMNDHRANIHTRNNPKETCRWFPQFLFNLHALDSQKLTDFNSVFLVYQV